eukprot:10538284-Karenia_brevis.AAC.1
MEFRKLPAEAVAKLEDGSIRTRGVAQRNRRLISESRNADTQAALEDGGQHGASVALARLPEPPQSINNSLLPSNEATY